MNKNIKKAVTLVVAGVLFFTGLIGNTVQAAPALRIMDKTGVELPSYPQILESWFPDFKNSSVISTGTNGRLDAFLQKMANGEHVIIVANGGSITEGSGSSVVANSYADRVVYGLMDRYPNAEIEYLNVGISAQPSSIGVMNYDRDVTLVLGNRAPDLVLLEYAVNDAEDSTWGAAYETMIRKALENPTTAVMLVFSMFKNGYNKQENYIPLGEAYGLPMVSMKNCLKPYFEWGLLNQNHYFWDPLHPSDFGHFLMAECILQLIDLKQNEINTNGITPIDNSIKGALYWGTFTHMTLISSSYGIVSNLDGTAAKYEGNVPEIALSKGSFDSKDLELRDSRRFDEFPFVDNFMHSAGGGNAPLQLTADFRELYINYKTAADESYGKVFLYLDGEYIGSLEGYEAAGYNNSNSYVIRTGQKSEKHTLRIQMTDDSKKFTIYNMALTR